MKPEEIVFNCARSIIEGQNITLTKMEGESWPKGFPRGELLSINPNNGCENYSFDPVRVLSWTQRTILNGKK